MWTFCGFLPQVQRNGTRALNLFLTHHNKMPILPFILSNWKLLAVGLLSMTLLGMGSYISLLKSQKQTLTAEKEKVEVLLSDSQADLVKLKAEIEKQNKYIQEFKAAAEEKLKKNTELLNKARKDAEFYRRQAGDIMGRQPTPGLPLCTSAENLINSELNNAKK